MSRCVDAVIIGGGFYGLAIASYLVNTRKLPKVLIIERENALMARASFNNQARVHNGYHYPRSFTTAYRSRINLPKFTQQYGKCVNNTFTKIYAIPVRNSKVTARQFYRFCVEIGAKIAAAPSKISNLFNPRLIKEVYQVEEFAFDATVLKELILAELNNQAEIIMGHTVTEVAQSDSRISVSYANNTDQTWRQVCCRYLFNCTYSGLNQINGYHDTGADLKHEITELALVDTPSELKNLGITVMDGPFFSIMPFPAASLHTLSHVRYTPHCYWKDRTNQMPYLRLDDDITTRSEWMIRDAARYLPIIKDVIYRRSLYEVKTVLLRNEGDDGRPILFARSNRLPGAFSILGGKIDNIFDILEKLDATPLQT